MQIIIMIVVVVVVVVLGVETIFAIRPATNWSENNGVAADDVTVRWSKNDVHLLARKVIFRRIFRLIPMAAAAATERCTQAEVGPLLPVSLDFGALASLAAEVAAYDLWSSRIGFHTHTHKVNVDVSSTRNRSARVPAAGGREILWLLFSGRRVRTTTTTTTTTGATSRKSGGET